jgi:transposase-like protein
MFAERAVVVSQTTIMRWLIRYAPEFESVGVGSRDPSAARGVSTRLTSQSRVTGTIVTGQWISMAVLWISCYGRDRGIAAAQAFFRKALTSQTDHPPLTITLDGHWHSHRALHLLRREHAAWRRVRVRSSKYLNNIVEQDHRAIKQRCGPMRGFKSFANAVITITGI